jgi:hypothetical protein
LAITSREEFSAVLFNGPLVRGDAIVLLAGEDADARLEVTYQIFKQRAANTIVVTGGLQDESKKSADTLRHSLIGKGVSPHVIVVDDEAKNTREQAVNVIDLAVRNDWKRLLLVASAYHCPRSYLTFLKRLKELDLEERIHISIVPASQSKWFGCPEGMNEERLDLLAREYAKIDTYEEHVARTDEGIDYLRYWEGV